MPHNTLEGRLGQQLRRVGYTLSVAESCTGGLVGHRLTNVPGSSDYYWGGVIAYAYPAKVDLLGVKWSTLEAVGAVSREVVIEMAQGVRRAMGTDIGLSVSGIAGPGGGTRDKPVGLVWVGLSTPDGDWAQSYQFDQDRLGNKEQAAQAALSFVLAYLDGKNGARTG